MTLYILQGLLTIIFIFFLVTEITSIVSFMYILNIQLKHQTPYL